jgi:hypothetical protein
MSCNDMSRYPKLEAILEVDDIEAENVNIEGRSICMITGSPAVRLYPC